MSRPVVERSLPDGADRADRAQADSRMRELLSRPDPGPVGERLALLHFTGRRTGRPYTVPAGVHRLGGAPVVATGSPWRHNFAGGADGELTWRGERTQVRFLLVADPERTAHGYLELYERYGEAAERRLGITVAGGRTPGFEEFENAVQRCGLSLVEVVPRTAATDVTTDTANERTPR
ncbi:hypothetical protein OG909_32575 [Streptomyces sp. NBC_01754]|uniref:hypothetical protein n=1 Tax=Streptomyces sp. NBC_01754 TaxID=2975930 RepID=UPI002DD81F17|nr:hypothetical protein [Streptomyces sp. NBC_01754]WSC90836.1 hypothetical protein OG909_00130 [Streptomyces sp. NBC_01754]WSC96669.1 hypothetical protein OG909_32575 [Streptomyces sp. NBC_01754]